MRCVQVVGVIGSRVGEIAASPDGRRYAGFPTPTRAFFRFFDRQVNFRKPIASNLSVHLLPESAFLNVFRPIGASSQPRVCAFSAENRLSSLGNRPDAERKMLRPPAPVRRLSLIGQLGCRRDYNGQSGGALGRLGTQTPTSASSRKSRANGAAGACARQTPRNLMFLDKTTCAASSRPVYRDDGGRSQGVLH